VGRSARRTLQSLWPLLLLACVIAAAAWSVSAQESEDQPPTTAEVGPTSPGEQVNPAELPTPTPLCPEAQPRDIPRFAPGAPGSPDSLDELKTRANEQAQRTATPTPVELEEDLQ
jgi:hypothetical protein